MDNNFNSNRRSDASQEEFIGSLYDSILALADKNAVSLVENAKLNFRDVLASSIKPLEDKIPSEAQQKKVVEDILESDFIIKLNESIKDNATLREVINQRITEWLKERNLNESAMMEKVMTNIKSKLFGFFFMNMALLIPAILWILTLRTDITSNTKSINDAAEMDEKIEKKIDELKDFDDNGTLKNRVDLLYKYKNETLKEKLSTIEDTIKYNTDHRDLWDAIKRMTRSQRKRQ